MAEQATLYNPATGDRQRVDVGSQDAQRLFGNKYVLEESYDQATGKSTYAGMDGPTVNDVPAEEAEINIAEGADLATGGYKDTFYEDAAKNYQDNTNDLAKFKMETIANMERRREARMIKEQGKADEATKGINEWTNYDTDAAIEEFKTDINYQDTLDKLNAIEMESADAWKSYQDLKNGISRDSNISGTQFVGKQNKYKEDYLAEATYLQMRTDIVQGNLNRIDKRVDRYYTQVDTMVTRQISNFKDVLKMSKNRVFQLEDKEESYVLETLNALEAKQEKETAERDAKRNLWQFAMQNNVDVASLGMTMQDDYDTMMAKISPAIQERSDLEFNRLHSGSGSGTGDEITTFPEGYDTPQQKFAYETAQMLVGVEPPTGFTGDVWRNKVNDFIAKADDGKVGPRLEFTEAEALLKDAMWRVKGTDLQAQEEPAPEDPDALGVELSEDTTATYWYQDLGDKIKNATSEESFNKIKTDNIAKQEKVIENLNNDISILEAIANPNKSQIRALKNAKSKLKRTERTLIQYKQGGGNR